MTDPSDRFALHPIRTEADYQAALKQAEAYFDAEEEPDPDSEEGAHFEALIAQIEAHERTHYPIAAPSRHAREGGAACPAERAQLAVGTRRAPSASNAVPMTTTDIAAVSDTDCAMNPINGGPTRKPE